MSRFCPRCGGRIVTTTSHGGITRRVKVMSRSSNAARYGALVERAARERYGLDSDHAAHHDARTSDGRPVETKAAMLNRKRGPGRFRVFEMPHRELVAEEGLYVFAAYRTVGRGLCVERIRSVDAIALDEHLEFYEAGGHRDSRQVKIPVSAIFS